MLYRLATLQTFYLLIMPFWKNGEKLRRIILAVFSIAVLAVMMSFSPAGKNFISSASEKLGLNFFSESRKQIGNVQQTDPVQKELPYVVSQNQVELAEGNEKSAAENFMESGNPDPEDKNAGDQTEPADTAPVRNSDLLIGVMADSHADTKTYWLIGEFAKKAKLKQPDFIIEAGDFIENRDKDGDGKQPREDGLADWRIADGYLYNNLGGIPEYHVVGNHEMFSLLKKDWENLTGRNNYYSFVSGNYQIIVLDAMYWFDTHLDVELNSEKAGAYVGYIPEKEQDWLKAKLKNHEQNIIFIHHPLYLLNNSEIIKELLKKYDDRIILIVSGHKHQARKLTFAGIDYIDMPSLELQRQYAIIEVNGKKATVNFLPLQ
jgi:predicted phosphodiesterase